MSRSSWNVCFSDFQVIGPKTSKMRLEINFDNYKTLTISDLKCITPSIELRQRKQDNTLSWTSNERFDFIYETMFGQGLQHKSLKLKLEKTDGLVPPLGSVSVLNQEMSLADIMAGVQNITLFLKEYCVTFHCSTDQLCMVTLNIDSLKIRSPEPLDLKTWTVEVSMFNLKPGDNSGDDDNDHDDAAASERLVTKTTNDKNCLVASDQVEWKPQVAKFCLTNKPDSALVWMCMRVLVVNNPQKRQVHDKIKHVVAVANWPLLLRYRPDWSTKEHTLEINIPFTGYKMGSLWLNCVCSRIGGPQWRQAVEGKWTQNGLQQVKLHRHFPFPPQLFSISQFVDDQYISKLIFSEESPLDLPPYWKNYSIPELRLHLMVAYNSILVDEYFILQSHLEKSNSKEMALIKRRQFISLCDTLKQRYNHYLELLSDFEIESLTKTKSRKGSSDND